MIPLSVPEIEGGSPERDGGGEEGQVWGNSRRLDLTFWALSLVDFGSKMSRDTFFKFSEFSYSFSFCGNCQGSKKI